MQQKNIQVYCFFTTEEMNELSILGGGGGGHEIIFDTSDGAMRFFGGNTMGHEKNRDFGGKSPARVDLYFMSAPLYYGLYHHVQDLPTWDHAISDFY